MPIPTGLTRKSKLLRWVKTTNGETFTISEAMRSSGLEMSRGAVSAALREFEMNGLITKIGRGVYFKPNKELTNGN